MTYQIPTDDQVIKAVRKVFSENNKISTQTKLKKLVEKKLITKKAKYQISPNRLRKLVLQSNIAKIEIYSREGDPKKILNRCPVCDTKLNKVKNQTIWGGQVTIEYRCSFCGYWTGKKKRIPTLYVFHIKK